jgi:hypothetical protein
LSDVERLRILRHVEEKHPRLKKRIGRLWNECRDWHLSAGVMRADWEATFRRWLRKQDEIDGGGGRPQIGSRELPQETGVRGGEPLPLLRLIGRPDGQ